MSFITSIVIDTEHENIHGADLGDQVVLTIQPEHLL
jgi:hypothetical protein